MRKISNALSKNRLESIRGEVKETLVMTISAQPQRPMRRRDRELPREEALRAARAAGHAEFHPSRHRSAAGRAH